MMSEIVLRERSIKQALNLLAEALGILDEQHGAHHAAAHLDLAICRLEELLELSVTASRARLEFSIVEAEGL